MSLKKRLEEKLGNLAVPVVTPSAPPAGVPVPDSRPAPKTAPGQMLAFRQHLQVHEVQVQDLQRQLDAYRGSQPARRIDPRQIRPSRWANRQEGHFRTPEFAAFKQELLTAGGNIQPIKVRPVADAADTYEVVFGHRRHRACLELGIPVETMAALASMGHRVQPTGGMSRQLFGRGAVIFRDPQSGVLWGGSDPRGDGCAMALG